MDINLRKKFLISLIDNVKADLLNENALYPDEWDGIELRERVKDAFASVVCKRIMTVKRKRDYNNFVIINNLIG